VKPTPPPTQLPSYSPTISQQPSPTHYGAKAGKGSTSSSKGSKGYSSKVQKAIAVNLVKVVPFLAASQVKVRQSPALVCSTTVARCLTQDH
jgi:hypothetical protein